MSVKITKAAVWHDREIRFDTAARNLQCRPGEFELDSINSVEDTKGNNGERGFLIVTNLRLIWARHKNASTNLSIGLNCVVSANVKTASSRLRGSVQALYLMTKFKASRFEFIFTSLVRQSPRLFTTVQSVVRAYETTKLYRDLKLRAAIIKNKQLRLLPQEQVYSKLVGVWNLATDQGNLGTLFITNVRVVWYANLAENFNVSIPYLQMKSIRVRGSRFGPALVIETRPESGSLVLGFRIDPKEALDQAFKEIGSLYDIFSANPIFGIEFRVEERPKTSERLTIEHKQDGVEIVNVEDSLDVLTAYYAEGEGKRSADVVYNEDLGLAMEKISGGYSVKSLWNLF